jgi:N-acetylglucosamine kinase-like BadF-type ATPase
VREELSPDGFVIALDGGGSKTDAVAIDRAGHVLAKASAGTSSPHLVGVDAAVDVVDSLVRRVAAEAGERELLRTCIYMSGLDLAPEIEAFAAAIERFDWSRGATGLRAVVDNDLFALLRAGTAETDAVAVVCGTGINCVGVRHDGAVLRYPALGTISGDWGGGWQIGEQALWNAARAVDGRGPDTTLVTAIPRHFGLPALIDVIEALHFGRLRSLELAALSPLVLDAAEAGDSVAVSIVDRQADEIAVLAVTTLRRLELLKQETPVVLGGGVLSSGNERLLRLVSVALAAQAPLAVPRLVTAPPILGAGLLALESIGASASSLDAAAGALAG